MGTLEAFLRKEKVLTKFKANKKRRGKSYEKRDIETFEIDTAFIWNQTPEGLDFWRELHEKYEKELDENK